MFTPMIVLLAFLLAGGTVVFLAARRAPVGFQDENGFHFGAARDRATVRDNANDDCFVAAYAPKRSAGDAGPRLRVRPQNDGAVLNKV
jgi:hypothetical protein